ncbi:MAG: hypothetical protein OHK003_28910 [Anaerolineales bacterium]
MDTITPSLNLSTNGTVGLNGWYQSNVSVTPTVSDAGSGVDKIEALIDNGSWSIPFGHDVVNSPSSFSDGVHTYQYKVTDQAGNITVTPTLTVKVDTVAPTFTAPTSLNVLETLHYELLDATSGLNQFAITVSDKDNLQPSAGSAWSLTGNRSEGDFRWSATFGNDVVAGVGWHPLGLRLMDMAGNETVLAGFIEVTRANLRYMELVGPNHQQVNPPNNSTGTIVYAPAATIPTTNQTQPTPDPSFGGENNPAPTEQDTTTTITQGETKTFEGMSIQSGGTSSFTAGNQSTNLPNTTTNVLWGAAAAAMLGATLAEWQKKREEEAARLAALIASNAGQGDEDEVPADVLARRRGKVIAKNQAKRAQEQAWEAARTQQQAKIAKAAQADMTQEEKLSAYKQTAGYIARQESYTEYYAQKAMEAQRAGERNAVSIAEEHKSQEQAKQNAGGKVLAIPFPQEPNPLDYEDCKPLDLACHVRNVKTWWNNLGTESSQLQPTTTPTSTLLPMTQTPTKTLHPDEATIIAYETANTPLPTRTPLPTSTPYLEDQLGKYGIKNLINVDSDLLPIIWQATQLTANKFQPFTSGTPQQAFIRSHGTIAIIIDYLTLLKSGTR